MLPASSIPTTQNIRRYTYRRNVQIPIPKMASPLTVFVVTYIIQQTSPPRKNTLHWNNFWSELTQRSVFAFATTKHTDNETKSISLKENRNVSKFHITDVPRILWQNDTASCKELNKHIRRQIDYLVLHQVEWKIAWNLAAVLSLSLGEQTR